MKLQSDDDVERVEEEGGGGVVEPSDEDADLPNSLIITNLDVDVFNVDEERLGFERLFRHFEEEATFQYFKSFRRAKVNFSSFTIAAEARIRLHQTLVGQNLINCYFAQPTSLKSNVSDPYLQLPAPVKQFLISPPASPPVGWEPVDEAQPVINYDLLSAIASLAPGEAHELHPPSETQPSIIVHICEEEAEMQAIGGTKPKIMHTSCPQRPHT